MKKILIVLVSLILLVGCSNREVNSNKSNDEKTTNLFKQEIKDITLAEMKAKNVPDEISEESIDAIINPMIEQSGILVKSKTYSEPATAMIKNGSDVKGGSKISVILSAEANEDEIKRKDVFTENSRNWKKRRIFLSWKNLKFSNVFVVF